MNFYKKNCSDGTILIRDHPDPSSEWYGSMMLFYGHRKPGTNIFDPYEKLSVARNKMYLKRFLGWYHGV